jgi:rod shape-determining protein MreD
MNLLTMILAALLIVFVERLIGSFLNFQIATLHLVPALILYYVVNRTVWLAIASSIVAGWMLDCVSGLPWGVSSISLVLISVIIRTYRDISFGRLWIEHFLLGALCGAMFVLFQYLLVRHSGEVPLRFHFSIFMVKMIFSAIFCGAISPFICRAMRFIENLLGNITIKEAISDERVAE